MKYLLALLAALAASVFLPTLATAHERQAFEIGSTTYLFVIGSQGEPVVVDDKTGIDLRVYEADPEDIGNTSAPGVVPVEGLEETLQVSVSAGDESLDMELSAAYGQPGSYKSLFFPTQAARLTYNVTGTINDTAVDLSFTCMPGDHVMGGGEANTDPVVISEGVTRVFQMGSFTCPREKAELGFPVPASSLATLEMAVAQNAAQLAAPEPEPVATLPFDLIALGVAVLALLLAIVACVRRPKAKVAAPTTVSVGTPPPTKL